MGNFTASYEYQSTTVHIHQTTRVCRVIIVDKAYPNASRSSVGCLIMPFLRSTETLLILTASSQVGRGGSGQGKYYRIKSVDR